MKNLSICGLEGLVVHLQAGVEIGCHPPYRMKTYKTCLLELKKGSLPLPTTTPMYETRKDRKDSDRKYF